VKPEEIINKLQTGGFKLDPSFIKLLGMVADEAMRYERQECLKICYSLDLDFKHVDVVNTVIHRIRGRENG
jgi:hypothetical protein